MKVINKEAIRKSKSRLQLVAGFYNPFIILGVVICYLILFYFPYRFLPDYWHFSEIENLRTFIWSLLTVTLGFSGLILTLLLLSYNFFIKSTKRNTLEFIFENVFLKILFSGFVSILLVQLAAYCMINRDNRTDKYAVIYFLLVLTVTYILAQLPIAILGLKYSTSIDKIEKVFASIDSDDVDYLLNTTDFLEKHLIEQIEGNRLILLKDIGLNAIKDADWILPQKILSNTFKLITKSIQDECPLATTNEAFYIFLWISKHFQRTAIKSGDQITVNVLAGQTLNLYFFISEHKIYDRSLVSQLDDYSKELIFSIIQSKDFVEIRDSWIKDYTEAMVACASSLKYDDDALPTKHYIFNERQKEVNYPTFSEYYQFWHHLIHTQFANLVDIVEYGIEQKDTRVYDTYHWQIRSLMGKIASLTNFTESQKRDYLSELLYRTNRLDSIAVENGLYEKLIIVSHIEIEQWAKNNWPELYRSAMYQQSSIIKSLIKTGKYYNSLLDEFFMLGRSMCNRNNNIELKIKEEILSYLLETGLKLYDNKGDSLKLKYDLQYQLKWLFVDFMQGNEAYIELNEKFKPKIDPAIAEFDYYNRPEF